MVWNLASGFRVVGLRAQGLEHRVEELGLRVWESMVSVYASGFGFRIGSLE